MAETGEIIGYGGTGEPTNWLLCNGQAVSRTTYATLFALIGETFGAGNGSTTFNVPDLRQRFPFGGVTTAIGTASGAIDHVHTGDPHTHTVTQPAAHGTHVSDGAHTHDAHTTAVRNASLGVSARLTGPATHNNVGGHTHDAHSAHSGAATTSGGSEDTGTANPPFQAINYLIRTAA